MMQSPISWFMDLLDLQILNMLQGDVFIFKNVKIK